MHVTRCTLTLWILWLWRTVRWHILRMSTSTGLRVRYHLVAMHVRWRLCRIATWCCHDAARWRGRRSHRGTTTRRCSTVNRWMTWIRVRNLIMLGVLVGWTLLTCWRRDRWQTHKHELDDLLNGHLLFWQSVILSGQSDGAECAMGSNKWCVAHNNWAEGLIYQSICFMCCAMHHGQYLRTAIHCDKGLAVTFYTRPCTFGFYLWNLIRDSCIIYSDDDNSIIQLSRLQSKCWLCYLLAIFFS